MNPGVEAANRRVLGKLLWVVAGMFGFVFALVPLYDVFCQVTGLGGKTSATAAVISDVQVDEDRLVTVEFVANLNQDMPWEFRPEVVEMRVHPGKTYKTSYYAQNLAGHAITGHAVPSVAPGSAARHFKKTECFCFTEQRFESGEGRDMPVYFMLDPRLPAHVQRVTLSYTFFDKDGV
jgi:cytochrome c oxidase assembly protein subunit 11